MDKDHKKVIHEDRWAYTKLEAEIIKDIIIVEETDEDDSVEEVEASSEERFTEAVKHLNKSLKDTEAFEEYCEKVVTVSTALAEALGGRLRGAA